MPLPTRVSNEIEDFQPGALYPGGTGKVVDISYIEWDYDGKAAKTIAVFMKFQPTDGSNQNAELPVHWSAGNPQAFQPDMASGGAFLVQVGAHEKQSDSSNWAEVLKALRNNCGMPAGKLNGENGIKALIGSEMTLARVDQKERDGLKDDAPAEPGKQKRKNQMLLPTRCKFAWEMAGGAFGARGAATRGVPAPTPIITTTTASAPVNGSVPAPTDAAFDASLILKEALDANGGKLQILGLSKAIVTTQGYKNVPKESRSSFLAQVKADIEVIAAESGWDIQDGVLSL